MFLLVFFMAHVVAMSSTIYNPFLYAWMNEYFRAEFRNIVPCLFRSCELSRTGIGGVSTACAETTACVGAGGGNSSVACDKKGTRTDAAIPGCSGGAGGRLSIPTTSVTQHEYYDDDDDDDAVTTATSVLAVAGVDAACAGVGEMPTSNGSRVCKAPQEDDSDDNGTEMSLLNHKAEV